MMWNNAAARLGNGTARHREERSDVVTS